MKAQRKKEDNCHIDEFRVFTGFTDFVKDRNFVTPRVAFKISSYDNKGEVMQVDTPVGKVLARETDIVIKHPNDVLGVMKAGHFWSLYTISTSKLDIDEEKKARKRVCSMLLDFFQARGITSFNKAESVIKKFAEAETDEKAEESEE